MSRGERPAGVWLGAAVAAMLILFAARPLRAEELRPEELRPVLLPLEGDSSIRSLLDEIERTFAANGRTLQRSSLGLEDLMLAVGCRATSIACLQEIGQNVKASGLIISRARRMKDGLELSLRWFDVKSGGDLGEFVRLLPDDSIEREKILGQAVRALLGIKSPTSQEQTGGLSVSASVPYVEILLDGQARGSVPLEFRELRPGTYTVLARREGYVTTQQQATVKAGQIAHVELTMTPAPPVPRQTGYLASIRKSTWITGGAGLLCIAVGAGFAAHLKAQQDHLNNSQGITWEEIQQMRDYKETGERDAVAANVLFGLGGAALVTAAVLSYLDYRRGRREARPPTTSLRVAPGSAWLRVGF